MDNGHAVSLRLAWWNTSLAPLAKFRAKKSEKEFAMTIIKSLLHEYEVDCQWKPSSTGYPCLIAWGDSQRYCQDKEALERALAELVNDPVIGEKLLITMNEQPLPPPLKETKGS
ncbi:MAG TPA: hypothetical protein DCZ05_12970 [Deltaproteobacteria bacterium]|nr:MAG: hypothetical protein A2253_05795 [Deltaproteobacteria bacterium RIFOXYA2_FULL_55_11]HBA40606.1 hypothetical protein [Deltaproteobacteria bacterium]